MEGTAGRLAYLNRIDDLLNVDLAHTTSQSPRPCFSSYPSSRVMKGWGLTDSPGLGGEGGHSVLLTVLSLRRRGWITPRHDGYHSR